MQCSDKYGVDIHCVIGAGWVHTHGMDRHGLPELEVRGVPGLLFEYAGNVLNEVCAYHYSASFPIADEGCIGREPNDR